MSITKHSEINRKTKTYLISIKITVKLKVENAAINAFSIVMQAQPGLLAGAQAICGVYGVGSNDVEKVSRQIYFSIRGR